MKIHRIRAALALSALWAGSAAAQSAAPNAAQLARALTAENLKADVAYLASDDLQGRATPSPGLDKAAEYIAAQFKKIGLEPAGDDGFFQTGSFWTAEASREPSDVTFEIDGQRFTVPGAAMNLQQAAAADLNGAPVLRVRGTVPSAEEARGKVLLIEAGRVPAAVALGEPAAVFLLTTAVARPGATRVTPREASVAPPRFPVIQISDPAFRTAASAAPNAEIKISAHVPAPIVKTFPLRNVVGVLRGADPALKETDVVVSAHYDHLGVRADGRIFYGADDDGSGTASVIELARALSAQAPRPKRSIVFVTFFGEELGGLGARYYTQHPVFPAARTVADINLEQLGRTDDTQGPHVGMFNLTGFDFTNMADVFRKAAADAGVEAVKDAANSDPYFSRSDNARFADAGIPSTTASVAYNFPDYHGVGDEAAKLDYANMAKVDVALALTVFRVADSAEAPQWNADVRATAPYLKAREASR